MYSFNFLPDSTYLPIGHYFGATDSMHINDSALVHAGFAFPRDRTQERFERQYINGILYIVMCCVSFMGICLAVVFLVFNVTFRSHR